jgi:leader peptidase (prepilin peptidase)/N-methyltransferase
MKQLVKDYFRPSLSWAFFTALALASIIGFFALDVRDATFGAALAALVLFVAAIDIDRFEIPDLGNLGILALGLAWTTIGSGLDAYVLSQTVLRIAFAAGFLFAIRAAYRLVRRAEGLGLGDIKLAGAGASWLLWPNLVLALLIAAGAAIMVVIIRSLLKGEKLEVTTAIPFGAFLAPAIWVAWFTQVETDWLI